MKPRWLLLRAVYWIFLLTVLSGCDTRNLSSATPSSSPTSLAVPTDPTIGSIATATRTMTVNLLATETATPVPILTPLNTLSPGERERQITEVVINNGGCVLPCWWGIVPGKTTFAEAQNFFRQFSPYPFLQEETPNKQFVNYLIPVSEHISLGYGIDIKLEIADGIVQIVSVRSIESSIIFRVQNMLSDYGQPSEVWVHTYRSYLGGIPPADVLLFYPEQGILARYSTELSNINESKDSASICLDSSPSLTLWSPEKPIDFEEVQDYARLDYKEYGKPLLPLEQTTNISLDEFYNLRTQERICINTTLSLWPEP